MSWTSLRTKLDYFVGTVCLLVISACVFVLHVMHEETRQINEVMLSNAEVTRAAQEALFSLSDASDTVQKILFTGDDMLSVPVDQRAVLEPAVPRFKLFINALTWGTESDSFRKVDGGRVYEQWKREKLDQDLQIQTPSPEARSAAGAADLYYDGVVKYFDQVLAFHDKYLGLLAVGNILEAEEIHQLIANSMLHAVRYKELTRESLVQLLSILNKEANERRLRIIALQDAKIRNFIIVFFALFIAVGALAWGFSTYVFIRPMHRLMEYTRVVAGGTFNVRVQIDSKDEIGELAGSLNKMAENLRDSYGSLEAKVAERTKELDTSRQAALTMMKDAEQARLKAEATADRLIQEMQERQKLENQLMQSQKMETVGTLAGGIAHDLNNQLTPVKGYIDLILAQTPPNDPNHDLLMEANMSVERCAEVIHRLMGFSRSSNQQKTVLSIPDSFKELQGLLKNFLPSTIRVEIRCREDIHPVYGNETELQTVFMNLATNARDAMPEGGQLVFDVKNLRLGEGVQRPGLHPGDYILVSVTDTGKGIPPDVIKHIFEPFFTTKIKGQGTGLGLAMVFKIVQDVGGLIEVSSTPGKGTTFHVYLPGRPGEPLQETRQRMDPELSALVGHHEMVLFADDEESIRKMGKVMLEKLGYKVWLCSDGQEAVSVYRDNRSSIHVLILDMTMPNLTGKQTMQKILEIDPKARIILSSGYTIEGSVQELAKLGAADVLHKPYTIIPLAKSLRAVLSPRP